MPKSNRNKKKEDKHDLHYHIRHKSRLTSLFIIKILLVFFICFLIFEFAYSFFFSAFGLILAWIISFVIAACLYLFLITKILHLFKF